MRRETKNEIVITVIVSLLIVAAAVYGLSTENQATSNENSNMSIVTSNQHISTLTNNGENVLNILNTSSSDNPSSTSTGSYPGTFAKNITQRINSSMM
jgi:hypothetical protein